MILEIAHLTVDAARGDEFEAAVGTVASVFRTAHGCRSLRLEREIEDPARYRLVVGWDSVEDHVVGFRSSPAFAVWRAAASPFFTAAPHVVHVRVVAEHF